MKRLLLLFLCFQILLGYTQVYAEIPRDDLRLELLFDGNTLDTSGLNRTVSHTGVSPQITIDSQYNIEYAKFSGSGGYSINTGWSGSSTNDFTITLLVKIKKNELFSLTGASYWDGGPGSNYYGYTVNVNYLTSIISSHISHDQNAFRLSIRGDYRCGLGGVWSNVPNYYFLYDSLIHPAYFVDCSRLSDEKWHLIGIRRNSGVLSFSIDGKEVQKFSNNSFILPRNIHLGLPGISYSTGARVYNIGNNILQNLENTIRFKSGMKGLRIYSRALSDNELNDIVNESRDIINSTISSTGTTNLSLGKYIDSKLNIALEGPAANIALNENTYEVSIQSGGYIQIGSGNISQIGNISGSSIKYNFSIDLSSYPDGGITINMRKLRNGQYENIGGITYIKITNQYDIYVNNPDSRESTSKLITAQTTSGGILTMNVGSGNLCNDSIGTFEPYSDLVFTNVSDNGIRICYKVHFPSVNITVFKISNPISGIVPANSLNVGSQLFNNYTNWQKSTYLKTNDSTYMVLDLLGVSASSSQGTINGVTMTDINGDGLVDFLYSRTDSPQSIRRAIIINNGNYTFKIPYKCAVDGGTTTRYYGDCADTTR